MVFVIGTVLYDLYLPDVLCVYDGTPLTFKEILFLSGHFHTLSEEEKLVLIQWLN